MEKDWEAEIRRLARDLSNARNYWHSLRRFKESGVRSWVDFSTPGLQSGVEMTREYLASKGKTWEDVASGTLDEEIEIAEADMMRLHRQLTLAKGKYPES